MDRCATGSRMHVDGFRFDLATALGARAHGFDPPRAFFDAILPGPGALAVKLIAEPWDLGEGGYQVGNFPPGWANGTTSTATRCAPTGRATAASSASFARAAHRLDRSVRGTAAAGPRASINFVTAHDGFTLNDLVSYNEKHNEANGEDNRDGNDDNLSWNCGVEGPDRRPGIIGAARAAEAQPPRDACCSPRACRCCWPATRWAARRAATTTPTARTTRSPGSTGEARRRSGDDLSRSSLMIGCGGAPDLAPARLLRGVAVTRRGPRT